MHGTEERAPRIHLSLHKGLVRRGRSAHIKSVGLTGDDDISMKSILDALEGHCKLSNNAIVAETAYRQLVQGTLAYQKYKEKCKEYTTACNFEAAYDKCLWNAILLGLRNQKEYEKCIDIRDKPCRCDPHSNRSA